MSDESAKSYRVVVDITHTEAGYEVEHDVKGTDSDLERTALIHLAIQQLRLGMPRLLDGGLDETAET